jgi:hypothetical protein
VAKSESGTDGARYPRDEYGSMGAAETELRTGCGPSATVTSTTVVLSLLMPVWNAAQKVAALESTHPGLWIVALMGVLFSAILPVFYLSLYRNEGTLRFSRRERSLAMITALALGVSLLIRLPQLFGSFALEGARSVLTPETEPWTLGDSSAVFGILSDAAYVLMMITVYRHVQVVPGSGDFPPASRLSLSLR